MVVTLDQLEPVFSKRLLQKSIESIEHREHLKQNAHNLFQEISNIDKTLLDITIEASFRHQFSKILTDSILHSETKLSTDDNILLLVENSAIIIFCSARFAEIKKISNSIPFQLLEDLLLSLTIQEIATHLSLLEWIIIDLYTSCTAKLPLLKALSQLITRCSKLIDDELNGRILVILAKVLPLSEKSGLNVKGHTNVNKTVIAEPDEDQVPHGAASIAQEDLETEKQKPSVKSEQVTVDKIREFHAVNWPRYQTFWGLQNYFSKPVLADTDEGWKEFSTSMEIVIEAFETSHSSGSCESSVRDQESAPWSPKYLTSPNIFRSQICDQDLRAQVLFQMVQALVNFSVMAEFQKHMVSANVLRNRIEKLLSRCVAPESYTLIQHTLGKEEKWITWKKNGCKHFEKEVVDRSENEMARPTRGKGDSDEVKKGPSKLIVAGELTGMGLNETWNPSEQNARIDDLDNYSTVVWTVSLVTEELKEDKALDDQEFKRKNSKVFQWKALHVLKQQNILYMTKISEKLGDLDAIIEDDAAPERENASTATNGIGDEVDKDAADGASEAEVQDGTEAVEASLSKDDIKESRFFGAERPSSGEHVNDNVDEELHIATSDRKRKLTEREANEPLVKNEKQVSSESHDKSVNVKRKRDDSGGSVNEATEIEGEDMKDLQDRSASVKRKRDDFDVNGSGASGNEKGNTEAKMEADISSEKGKERQVTKEESEDKDADPQRQLKDNRGTGRPRNENEAAIQESPNEDPNTNKAELDDEVNERKEYFEQEGRRESESNFMDEGDEEESKKEQGEIVE